MRKFSILLLLSILTGCSTTEVTGKTQAEKLYKESLGLVKNGRYLLASEKLTQIRGKYPYSYYAVYAELMLADVLFLQENYAESAAAYIVFKDFHPKHDKIDYVFSRIGESFFKQVPSTFDRDLAPAYESIKYFSHLIRSYPESTYIKGAKEKIEKCQGMLQNKEKYIADFYFKTEVYDAARYRYSAIIKKFNDKKLTDHSILRALLSSIKIDDKVFCAQNHSLYLERISPSRKEDFNGHMRTCLKISQKEKKVEEL
jgi:outer membrane protein assembly factor BamD